MRDRRFWIGMAYTLFLAAPVVAQDPPKPAATPQDVRALAETIDRLVAARWDQAHVEPVPKADDAEFLRRAWLDLAGKIPTTGEARDFLDDPAPDKRERLVERLLDSPAFISYTIGLWRELLLPEADANYYLRYLQPSFEAWLRERVAAGVGDDRLVRELLTTPLGSDPRQGLNLFDPRGGPSPAAFYLAKDGKPENLAAGTARLFLGLRLECAQCHDHPFASWTREEFWGLAAFFGGISRQDDADNLGPIREVADRRELAIPGTDRVAQATFLDHTEPQWRFRVGSREVLADWLTAPGNPYFARAAANRLWARFFGIGLVDPVDDLGPSNPPSHPELLDELARQFAAHGFDERFLIRAITASRPYQLTSAVTGPKPPDPRLFARMAVRALDPAPLFDSLAQATGYQEEAGSRNPLVLAQGSPRARFLETFANRDEAPTEAHTSILQALALMNGPVVAGSTRAETGATLGAVAGAPYLDTPGRIEALFLAALTRRPRPEETAKLVAYVEDGGPAKDRQNALADVFWVLLNSAEFKLNH